MKQMRTSWMMVLLCLMACIGCRNGPSGQHNNSNVPEDTSEAMYSLPATTKYVSEENEASVLAVEDDGATIVLDADSDLAASLAEGDVLMFGITSHTPNGLLRKVSSKTTSAEGTVVTTGVATMPEAFEELDLKLVRSLPYEQMDSYDTSLQGLEIRRYPLTLEGDTSGKFEVGFDGTVLYDVDGDKNTTYDQVVADGAISFSVGVTLEAKIEWSSLKRLKVGAAISQDGDLAIKTTLVGLEFEKEVVLGKMYFAPFMVGLVVFTPKLELVLGATGDLKVQTAMSVSELVGVEAGAVYENGKWTPYSNITSDWDFQPPNLTASAQVKAYIGPRFSLELYGVAGPYGQVTAYLDLSADISKTPWWELYAGLEGSLGIQGEILGYEFLKWELSGIVDYRKLLAQSEGTVSCEPDCSGRECGLDPACGETCGSCAGTTSCMNGQCADPTGMNTTLIHYYSVWGLPYIHYGDTTGWTDVPGVPMQTDVYLNLWKYMVTWQGPQLEFVFNDGHENWDNLDGIPEANYVTSASEVWVIGNTRYNYPVPPWSDCQPACIGKECGNGGCADLPNACGSCGNLESCQSGQCVGGACVADCAIKECGDDGCGGSCGGCPEGYFCKSYQCEQEACQPDCTGNDCGPDGCGSVCGICGAGAYCQEGQCKVVWFGGRLVGQNKKSGEFGESHPGYIVNGSCSFTDFGSQVYKPRWSPSGCSFAHWSGVNAGYGLTVRDLYGDELLHLDSGNDQVETCDWLSDDVIIYTHGGASDLYYLDVNTASTGVLQKDFPGSPGSLIIQTGQVAYWGDDGSIWIGSIDMGGVHDAMSTGVVADYYSWLLDWRPDLNRLVVRSGETSFTLWNALGTQVISQIDLTSYGLQGSSPTSVRFLESQDEMVVIASTYAGKPAVLSLSSQSATTLEDVPPMYNIDYGNCSY